MRRRDFILAGGAAVALPLAAHAQQQDRLRRIVLLGDTSSVWNSWTVAFRGRLSELGWIEGRTVAIEYHWSEGRPERVASAAAEFVQQKPDVIVTYGGAVLTLKQVTGSSIPIVFALAVDPLGVGLIASLSHPGDNVTGTSIQQAEIAGKRLDLMRQVLPNLRRLAIMFDGGYRAAVGEKDVVQSVARKLGLEAAPHEIRTAEEISPYINALKGEADALYVVENALTSVNRVSIITFALNARLPTAFTTGDAARDGALMAYGPNLPALFRRAADYVDKILRGAKPGDLPVEQPTKFDLVINLHTAKALGIEVPNSMQLLADEVVE